MVKALTVYKASAGSGKTFTLATEYIKLLVMNPTSYRNILAVTFTNKATEEMKMRILSQLYGIWKRLPDSDHYLQHVAEATGYDEKTVRERAETALHLLLHNYSYFRVETIDAFFQSVLRNIARELDLTANLRISLNDTQVEEQAVDRLIDSLTHTDLMLQWIMSYIMEKISDDRSWNIISQVKSFGKNIFNDHYKENKKELNEKMADPDFFDNYTQQLKQIRDAAAERMKEIAETFFDTLAGEGLSGKDLLYAEKGVYGFFVKLRNSVMDESIEGKRVCECKEVAAKWCKKDHPRAAFIQALADETLIPLLRYATEERPRQYRLFKSASLTLDHLNQLRLLGNIDQQVRNINDETNRFLLSDTQHLLQALISDSDSPFIFEKIGTQLEHVMIDEFQDTSTIQWRNFKVLLRECMSHQHTENLIVGDVKQSIYRWRSGDWRLLNAIDQEFPYPDETLEIKPLETNYRSLRNIIEFNNAFFSEAVRLTYDELYTESPQRAEQLRSAYADVVQQVPAHRQPEGQVSICMLPSEDYTEQTLNEISTIVEQLMEQGATPDSIAILVRNNKYIPIIANYFSVNKPDVRIVSDEAFRLDASPAVCLLVQALHLLTHPDDTLSKATVVKLYHRSILGESTSEEELLIKGLPTDGLMPEAYTEHREELLRLPLFELVERLYQIFNLHRLGEQSAYLCAFYDSLNKFTQDNSTDIDAFVKEWDDTLCSKTIQSNDTEGIRILSIHKSKGLEFNHVIVPFCNWQLVHGDTLWCEPDEAPFNALPVIPIRYSGKQMKGTIYEQAYLDELLQNTVDNLNLLYVALTRAVANLYVIGQRGGDKSRRSAIIENVLPALCDKLANSTLEGVEQDNAPLRFHFGTLSVKQHNQQQSQNIFMQPAEPLQVDINVFDAKTEFRQSNKSRDFIEGEDEHSDPSYIKIGSVLHELFSTIRTEEDIDGALLRLQQEGVLYDNEITKEKLAQMLRKRLESKQAKDWFSNRWNLFNECSILQLMPNGEVRERRPDRVMTDGHETHVVDFKFGQPKEEYLEQVREYMRLLRQMNMPHVRGWLWYVYSNRIEEVTSDE
ncbi:MAG: UvrD-helicase domain-containing protein [Prevotella sp.]|nr:UvrD-helicase domain-containing protein [Prevotella sp.]